LDQISGRRHFSSIFSALSAVEHESGGHICDQRVNAMDKSQLVGASSDQKTQRDQSSLAPYQNNTSMRGNCLEPRPLSWCMWRRDIWIATAFLLIFPSPRLKRAPQPKIARKRIKTSAPNALTLLAPHNPASPTPYFFLPSTRNSSFSQHQSFLLPITRYA
jgi:hypothetical protein